LNNATAASPETLAAILTLRINDTAKIKSVAMKKLPIILFSLFIYSFGTQAQQNIFPDTFPNTKGISEVIVRQSCSTCIPPTKDIIYEKYLFDANGNNIAWYAMHENKPDGKQTFNYQNGKLISYQNFSTHTSVNDSEMIWNSSILTSKAQYQYTNGQLANAKWFEDTVLIYDINYLYDGNRRIKEEQKTNYPIPNYYSSFEPNSDSLLDNPDAKKLVHSQKQYINQDSTTTIKYYKENILTGVETIKKDNKGNILSTRTVDAKGKLLKQVTNSYNIKGQLIEKSIKDTGFDGFGLPYDYPAGDKEIYEYDSSGKLKTIKTFAKDFYLVKTFEYKS
jgi:hypothetical protein